MLKPAVLAPKGRLDAKPPHGQPCTHCGLCCEATLCPLGQHVFKTDRGPCPALSYDGGGKSVCGLIVYPEQHASIKCLVQHGAKALGNAAALLNGSGLGCDARFNGEAPDEKFYAELRQWDHEHRKEIRQAKAMWEFTR